MSKSRMGCWLELSPFGPRTPNTNYHEAPVLFLAQLKLSGIIALVVGIHDERKNRLFIWTAIRGRTTVELDTESCRPISASIRMATHRTRRRNGCTADSRRIPWIIIIHDPTVLLLQSIYRLQ